MQSVWYSIKVIAVQKRPEALGLIAICLVGGFQNSGPMAVSSRQSTARFQPTDIPSCFINYDPLH